MTKMKIGILTQPLLNNYGGLLQAYALQTTLTRLGFESLFLDRHHSQSGLYRAFKSKLKRLVLRYILGKRDVEVLSFQPSLEQRDIVSRETRKFLSKHINKTVPLYSTDDLVREAVRHNFDAYIVGSDQVWRVLYSPRITNYFLDFVENVSSAKRIAYAASFGVDFWHYKSKMTRQCRRLAQKFDAISIREDSGIDLCRQYLNIDAVHVLDPTMLLEVDDYQALVLDEGEIKSPGDLMTYILDPSPEKTELILEVASALGLKPFTVMPSRKLIRETQSSVEECVYPPVTRWLRGYMDAKFVIADSFHGCVFALLFNIPFIAISNKHRGLARFESLLKQFDLSNRLIDINNEKSFEMINSPIDWAQVNKKMIDLKKFSINYLKNNLMS